MLTTKIKCALVAVAWAATIVVTWHLTGLSHEAELSKIRETAASELSAQVGKVLEKEREIKTLQTKIEKDFISYEEKLITANTRFNARLNDAFRLRDPNATGCAPTSPSGTTPTGDDSRRGELSRESTEFLWGESARADRVAGRLALCQQYVEVLQQQIGSLTKGR